MYKIGIPKFCFYKYTPISSFMSMPSKRKSITSVIIINILLLTISNTTIFSGSVQSSDDIDLDALIPEPTILYDSVELFPEGQSTLSLTFPFQKNWIYYFSFESYVPFSDRFMLDAFCQTPAGRNYHFFDYNDSIENDVEKFYFEYGAAEIGSHLINIVANTSQNMNIHVYIEEYLPLETYYPQFSLEQMNKSGFFCDINRYSTYKSNKIYSYPVLSDTEYKFNFFRVNPISQRDIEENHYENPTVEMIISLNGTIYRYYQDIPTLDYALYGNVENAGFLDVDRNLDNDDFLARFGAHCTENLTVLITIEGFIPFDLNFAFLVWEVGEIGNGTDGIGTNENMTIPNPLNNNTDPELHKQSLTKTLDAWIARAGLFIQSNWWTLFIVTGGILIAATVFGKYKYFFKDKVNTFKERIGSEVYDNKEEITKEDVK